MPSPYSVLCLEVHHTFWEVLAYEHDGLISGTAAAFRKHTISTNNLRRAFDPHPELGPAAADAWIAHEVAHARRRFAEDLARERFGKDHPERWKGGEVPTFFYKPYEWRSQRGQPRGYQ